MFKGTPIEFKYFCNTLFTSVPIFNSHTHMVRHIDLPSRDYLVLLSAPTWCLLLAQFSNFKILKTLTCLKATGIRLPPCTHAVSGANLLTGQFSRS